MRFLFRLPASFRLPAMAIFYNEEVRIVASFLKLKIDVGPQLSLSVPVIVQATLTDVLVGEWAICKDFKQDRDGIVRLELEVTINGKAIVFGARLHDEATVEFPSDTAATSHEVEVSKPPRRGKGRGEGKPPGRGKGSSANHGKGHGKQRLQGAWEPMQ